MTTDKLDVTGFRFCELHDDLKPYFDGRHLTHPLVQHDRVGEHLFDRLNRLYLHRQRLESGKYVPNEWDEFYPDESLQSRFDCLFGFDSEPDMAESVERDEWVVTSEFRRILGLAYKAPELIAPASSLYRLYLSYGGSPCFEAMNETEQSRLVSLPNQITVYRGHVEGLLRGDAWSLLPEVAWRWAVGGCGETNARIACGTIRKSDIVAYLNHCGEYEILVDGRKVRINHVFDGFGRTVCFDG